MSSVDSGSELLRAGTIIGRYTLERRLGAGGMAEVWAARDPFGGPVAIKLLYPNHGESGEFEAMFRDEIRILSQIRHPNVVEVRELGQDASRLWMAMELLDGLSLHALEIALENHKERFPVPIAAWIGLSVAEGLEAVHAARGKDNAKLEVVHRDVAPNNVMLTRTGIVKVIDFGVARARNRAVRTQVGVVKGRIAYMAPEQAMGSEVSGKADVFALGVVLWEMIAMRRLFPAGGTLLQVVQRPEPPSLRAFGASFELDDLVRNMLALTEEDRPTMSDVVSVLRRTVDRQRGGRSAVYSSFRNWVDRWVVGADQPQGTGIMPVPAAEPTPVDDGAIDSTHRGGGIPADATVPNGPLADPTLAMSPVEPVDMEQTGPLELPTQLAPAPRGGSKPRRGVGDEDDERRRTDQGFGNTSALGHPMELVIPQELTGPHDASPIPSLPSRAQPTASTETRQGALVQRRSDADPEEHSTRLAPTYRSRSGSIRRSEFDELKRIHRKDRRVIQGLVVIIAIQALLLTVALLVKQL